MATEMNPAAASAAGAGYAQAGRSGPAGPADGSAEGRGDGRDGARAVAAEIFESSEGYDGEGRGGLEVQGEQGDPGEVEGRDGDLESGEEAGDDGDGEWDEDAPAGLTRGIWWAAVLLPFLSVAGAILCFSAGVLNSGGCQPEGSALCSGGGQWFTFVLPLFVAPLVAAVTAIGGVVAKRHRSSWLAFGYLVVFVSVLIGLASANSGSS